MYVLLTSVFLFILWLLYERIIVDRYRRSIPAVITVTGTRGKSTVVRLLASVLRSSDKKVVAKTTGSRPSLILPDGSEEDIKRRGRPSIIEQKRLLKSAAEAGGDIVVAEMMSIHPENHFIEGCRLLKPDLVLVTNVRTDHLEAVSDSLESTAMALAAGIPDNATLICERETLNLLKPHFQNNGSKVIVPGPDAEQFLEKYPELLQSNIDQNIRVVYSAARSLGIDEKSIYDGLVSAAPDSGAFRIRKHKLKNEKGTAWLVNAFAANDPESTEMLLEKTLNTLSGEENRIIGVIALRKDRGDRTIQWLESLQNGMASKFDRIYVTGGHARAFKQKLPHAITFKTPDELIENCTDNDVLFGFGNMIGKGEEIIDYWITIGDEYGI